MKSISYIIVITLSLLNFACQRHTDVFRYMSMENDGYLEKVSEGVINNSKIKLDDKIVLEYKLDKDLYDITLALDPSGLMPNMIVSIDNMDDVLQ